MRPDLPLSISHEVRDRCLCLNLQRAARATARRFDEAFKPLEITQGQFSILMSLNRPKTSSLSEMAALLAMDRTTLTANLKPLERRGLLTLKPDPDDRRKRRPQLTDKGRDLLIKAVPIWRATHDALDETVPGGKTERLRKDLMAVAFAGFGL